MIACFPKAVGTFPLRYNCVEPRSTHEPHLVKSLGKVASLLWWPQGNGVQSLHGMWGLQLWEDRAFQLKEWQMWWAKPAVDFLSVHFSDTYSVSQAFDNAELFCGTLILFPWWRQRCSLERDLPEHRVTFEGQRAEWENMLNKKEYKMQNKEKHKWTANLKNYLTSSGNN